MYSEESVDLLEKLVDKFETLCLLEQARCERAAREKERREPTLHERMIQALEEYQIVSCRTGGRETAKTRKRGVTNGYTIE